MEEGVKQHKKKYFRLKFPGNEVVKKHLGEVSSEGASGGGNLNGDVVAKGM